MRRLGYGPLGHKRSRLPELLEGREAQRKLARAALREWRKLAAVPPAGADQDGGEADA